ncbi:MAG: Transcriptional activator of fatty acid utilization [Peltula sp. TS41687]|nr:MAG: Transcriptional activator of fatty acid utilization [Peltula sp. TS41687]
MEQPHPSPASHTEKPPPPPPSGSPSKKPNSQTPGRPSFRRQRASKACSTSALVRGTNANLQLSTQNCHLRKVRCDVSSSGVPCHNCVAFSVECKIPPPKRKRTQQAKAKDSDSEHGDAPEEPQSASPITTSPGQPLGQRYDTAPFGVEAGTPSTSLSSAQAAQQAAHNATWTQFMKPKFARAPIKEAGRVAYLGESSNLSLLVHDRHGTTDVVHYPLPDNIRGIRGGQTEPDALEMNILHQRGAFLLPGRSLCDELVEAYFKWIAPVVPVINKSRFMRQYRDPNNLPSLLLLQAVLLAGSRVCNSPQLMDANGSTTPAAITFYKRAKALYDANYEDDRVTIVQSLILMGWYWEGPEDVTKNVFYWTRVATIIAQGSGMHRSVEGSQLSRADKRLWKRIWWTLFNRDRSVAVALGRPVHINTDDSDVPMISEDDFIEDEDDQRAEYPPDSLHVQFFLQYVKLCEIMGLVLSQEYSPASRAKRHKTIELTHSDMALADWLQNCPKEMRWEPSRHCFWAAILHSNYYTTLCLLHRAHMPGATTNLATQHNGFSDDTVYPSTTIAFQAAAMITSIVDTLSKHHELRYCPAFIVYSLFSALIMHVYQMRSSVQYVIFATQEGINKCMNALKEVSKTWLVAKMVHTLFEFILGNKVMEDKLQKAAGKRHTKRPKHSPAISKREGPPKRKYDDVDMTFSNGPPAPQVSYERSSATPSREIGPGQGLSTMPAPSNPITSPNLRQPSDTLMGNLTSRSNTRPPTPFHPSFSMPSTPPDLFLVTRNSPQISQNVWENFQPDQLFPENSGNLSLLTQFLPPNLDPQLMDRPAPNPPQAGGMPGQRSAERSIGGQTIGSPSASGSQSMTGGQGVVGQPWPNQLDSGIELAGNNSDDTMSNSSKGAMVPTTLNVEDWLQFFGINGDLNGMNTENLTL